MKLIDADALIERLDKRKTYEAMDGRNKAYVKGVRDAMKDVASAPAINAIPVEWIKARHKNWCWDSDRSVCERFLLDDWQKEQEAR